VSANHADFYGWYNEDWGWTHTFSPPGPLPTSINYAILEIEAWDVDRNEVNDIYVDSEYAGKLDANYDNQWHTTTFTLTDSAVLSDLMDGSMYVFLDIDSTHTSQYWAMTLRASTLTVDYDTGNSPSPAPEPTTMLLVGKGLVGFAGLKRKIKK